MNFSKLYDCSFNKHTINRRHIVAETSWKKKIKLKFWYHNNLQNTKDKSILFKMKTKQNHASFEMQCNPKMISNFEISVQLYREKVLVFSWKIWIITALDFLLISSKYIFSFYSKKSNGNHTIKTIEKNGYQSKPHCFVNKK